MLQKMGNALGLRSPHQAINDEFGLSGYSWAAGYFSGLYDGNQYDDSGSELKGGYYIASGVVIENAIGGSGNDRLIGNSASNLLSGNDGNDTLVVQDDGNDVLRGGSGDDKYIVTISAAHIGNITIDNYAPTNGYDTLSLNYSAQQLLDINVLKVDNDLIYYLDANSSLCFENWFLGGLYQLDKITLTDGNYTAAEFQNTFWDVPKDDNYTFSKGDGNITINDNGGMDRLKLADVNIKEVNFARDGNNLTLTVISTGEMITIRNHYGDGQMEKFYFKDATTNATEMEYILKGAMLGTDERDSFIATPDSDIMLGLKGNDSFVFYGQDSLNENEAKTDTIIFSEGFGYDNISFDTWTTFIGKLNLVFTDMRSTDFTYTIGSRFDLYFKSKISDDILRWDIFDKDFQNKITFEFTDQTLGFKEIVSRLEGERLIYIGTDEDDIYDSTSSKDHALYLLHDGNDRLIVDNPIKHIYAGAGNDNIIFTSLASNIGNSYIYGEEGNDTIDLRRSNVESAYMSGGSGNDILYDSSFNSGQILGQDGDDIIYLNGKQSSASSGKGSDIIYSGAGDNGITSTDTDNTIYYSFGSGNDRISAFYGSASLIFTDISSQEVNVFKTPWEIYFYMPKTGEIVTAHKNAISNYIFTDGEYKVQEDGNIALFGQFDAPGLYEKAGETTIDRFDFVDESFTAQQIIDIFMAPPPPPLFS